MADKRFDFKLDSRLCKSCGICVALCPKELLAMGADRKPAIAQPELCIGCKTCEVHCPDFAIRIGRAE